jgi:hypothetical protein
MLTIIPFVPYLIGALVYVATLNRIAARKQVRMLRFWCWFCGICAALSVYGCIFADDSETKSVLVLLSGLFGTATFIFLAHLWEKQQCDLAPPPCFTYYVWLNPTAYFGEPPKNASVQQQFRRQRRATRRFLRTIQGSEGRYLNFRVSIVHADPDNALVILQCSPRLAELLSTTLEVAAIEHAREVEQVEHALESIPL